jgi:myo-inositol 2-dehydrogenase / D-chiro-inositol 1-dehydrogenase
VIATCAEAKKKNLAVVSGLCYRYEHAKRETMKRVHEGAIGDIIALHTSYCMGGLWVKSRQPAWTDMEWQLRNWLYFTWLSGDHICEQHVHNLDVMNWAINAHPTECVGMGGRQVRTDAHFGHIFDHFAIDYTYPNDVHVMSMSRQIPGCEDNVSESVAGTRGICNTAAGPHRYQITGERAWSMQRAQDNEPYQAEHVALFESIRGRRQQRINDLRQVAESTLTAIMGRMSAYTGRKVTWDQALNSQQTLMPERLTWDTRIPTPAVAVPGVTELT